MLDPKFVRTNPDRVRAGVAAKGEKVDLDAYLALDKERLALLLEVDALKAERNRVSEEIAALVKSGGKPDEKIEAMRAVAKRIKDYDEKLKDLEEKLEKLILWIPNLPHSSVPVGRSEEDAFKLFTAGQVAMFMYGEWGQDSIAARAPNMNYGIGLLPRPASGKSIGTFGGWEMAISKKSKNKDIAFKFLEYAAEASVNKAIASLTPANKEAALAFLKEKRKFPDVIYEQLTGALYRPLVPNYPEIAEIQRAATQAILLGQGSTKDILDDAAAKINAKLK